MLTICKNNRYEVEKNIKSLRLDAIMPSTSDIIDEIILAMIQEGVIDCLDNPLTDKRRHNACVPFKLVMALAIASKMKGRSSLTDIPYAISDHRVLAELGYNIINHDREDLFTEGTIRYLLGKYLAEEWVNYYNNTLQNIFARKGIETNIHILDCTKVAVNYDNENYENSSITLDRKGNKMRGYKISSLRGIYKDTGIIEEIRFGTASIHDLHLSEEMLKTTNCFKYGDILINDRGFLSRELINYLKVFRGVDTYVPLRHNMVAFEQAVLAAKELNNWMPHPYRKNQSITAVSDLGMYWESDHKYVDVPINICVVWEKETDTYFVFATTNIKATASEIIKIYEMRTEIEEDFRQLKDFWKLEDFKSTKYNVISFHIVCVLLGYLFYQLYINSEQGQKYLGKSLPVLLKKQGIGFISHLVLYSGKYFCCMSLVEFFEFRDGCAKEVQKYLLKFFKKKPNKRS